MAALASRSASKLELALELLRRRGRLAAAVFALCATLTTSFALSLPDVYRATAIVLVERPDARQAGAPGAAELETRLQSLSQRILSRAQVEKMIETLKLYQDMPKASLETKVERMRRETRIEAKAADQGGMRATTAFNLTYWGSHPSVVGLVTNWLARTLIEEDAQASHSKTSGVIVALKAQLDDTKGALDEQESRVATFKRSFSGELPQQVEVNLAALGRLNAQLQLTLEAQNRVLERREALQRQLAESPETEPRSGLETGAQQLARLRQKLAELRQSYSDKYPDVVRLNQEIDALERAPQAPADDKPNLLEARLGQLDAQLRELKAEEQRVRGQLAQYQQRVETAPTREQELLELSRDHSTTRALYESLLKRYEEAQWTADSTQSAPQEVFRMLDPPLIPERPAGPNRLLLILGGLLLAVAVAAGAAALREQMDTSFHSAEEVLGFTRVPVLVSIPRIQTQADQRRRWRRWLAVVPLVLCMAGVLEVSRVLARAGAPLAWLLVRGRG